MFEPLAVLLSTLHFVARVYLCISDDYRNKQQLFPETVLTVGEQCLFCNILTKCYSIT